MKRRLLTILSVVVVIALIVMGVFNVRHLMELRQQTAVSRASVESREAFIQQQIRLYEIALNSKPDDSTIRDAELRFAAFQEKAGQLKVTDPNSVCIISIPEVWLEEHTPYSWRIYVPQDQNIELAAFESFDSTIGSNYPEKQKTNVYSQRLPEGESVIRFVWKDGSVSRLLQLGIREAPPDSGVTLFVGASQFRWDHPSSTRMMVPSTPREKLLTTTPILTDKDEFDLLEFSGLEGMDVRALHLAIRRLPERKED